MNKKKAVRASFGRCLTHGDIMERFYEIFMNSNPLIGPYFADTDFVKQKALLCQGINLAIMFAEDNPVGKNGIKRIAKSHAHTQLNIPSKLYAYWRRSFIQAVSEFDPQFTADLKSQWQDVLQKSIDYITAYDGTESA